jgi:hypothetical protein
MELRQVDSKAFDAHIAAGGGGFAIMGKEGDVKSIWDPTSEDEVEIAEKQFNDMKAKGYTAFKVDDKGAQTTKMTKFDPKAGKVIFTKPVVGG